MVHYYYNINTIIFILNSYKRTVIQPDIKKIVKKKVPKKCLMYG